MSEDYADENKKFLSQWLTNEQLQKMTAYEARVFREKLMQGLEEMQDPNWVTKEPQFQITRQCIREIEEQALKKLRNRKGDDNSTAG